MILDKIDRSILVALQANGRITNVDLAGRVNLSEAACLRRVRALEEQGFIAGYVALVNPKQVGLPASAFVQITLQQEQQKDLEAFEKAIGAIPEVMECHLMTGDFDYLVRVVVADIGDFERIHRRYLTNLPGVARVHSSFALRTVTKKTALPLV
ncbi:MAG: Lrp/AsnC family transcriptional regulator [Gammaproteobacteria bacterium]